MIKVTYPLELFELVEFSSGCLAEYPLDLLPDPAETESLILTSQEEASIVKNKDYVSVPFYGNIDLLTSSYIMLATLLKYIKPKIVTINSIQKENIDLCLDSLVRRNSKSGYSKRYKYYQLSHDTYLCTEYAVISRRMNSEFLYSGVTEYGFAILDLSRVFIFTLKQ